MNRKTRGGTALNKVFNKLKKHWITVWLVLAVLGIGVFVVFGAYTGIVSVKRVVSMTKSAGVLFSSNSMQTYASNPATRHLTTSQSSGNYVYNLTVCDFAQSDPFTRYISDSGLSYNLSAQLYVKINNDFYPVNDTTHVGDDIRTDAAGRHFSIQYVSDGGSDVSASYTNNSLRGGGVIDYTNQVISPNGNGTNKYAITFDEYELGDEQTIDYYVRVEATPIGNSGSFDPIACYLYLTRYVAQDSSWRGTLRETTNLADYDAYNYIVEGSGSGTVTIRWNSSYIDVSEIFIAQNNLTVTTEAADDLGDIWKSFEIEVGHEVSGTVINRYEMQLFKNNENGSYSNVASYISCSYVAD